MDMNIDAMQAQDACQLLDADHLAVKHLFVEYARLAAALLGGPGGGRKALAMQICAELTVHATLEEEIFYPAVEQSVPGTAGLLKEARSEHQEAKQMITNIQALGADGPEMDALVCELNRAIEHHVKEERDEIFPKVRAAGTLDLAELAGRLRERQQQLQAQAAV